MKFKGFVKVIINTMASSLSMISFLSLEASKKKKLHKHLRGGVSMDLSRLPFDTIHPIRMIFDTYNKLLLYFHLSEITWYLIGFHDNHRYINDVTSVRNLGLSNFQI